MAKAKRPKKTVLPEAPPASERQAAYFLSLTVRNVRCFGDEPQTIDFSDRNGRPRQWTVLLGENGTGKTTLLQLLAMCETVSLESEGECFAHLPRSFLKMNNHFGNTYRRNDSLIECRVKCVSGPGLCESKGEHESISLEVKEFPLSNETVWSLRETIFSYGAGRRLGPPTLSEIEPTDASASLFDENADLRNAEEWLLRADYAASKPSEIQDQQKQRLEQVRQLLIGILPDVEDIRITAPTKAKPNPGVEFQTPYGWVPLRQLGYGYRTMIAWMVDFASRMVDRYPDSPNPLAEPAVVLVDEIDLHMHPRWQRQVIQHLTKQFPNTQFIVTAHSPLIVQAAEDANLVLLKREGDHVVIDNDVEHIRGWRVDQILTSDLFGLPSARPPQLDEQMRQREELLTKPKLTAQDRRKLSAIESALGPLPTGETAAEAKSTLELIRETQALLKRENEGP